MCHVAGRNLFFSSIRSINLAHDARKVDIRYKTFLIDNREGKENLARVRGRLNLQLHQFQ
jgi:hypothetical protein